MTEAADGGTTARTRVAAGPARRPGPRDAGVPAGGAAPEGEPAGPATPRAGARFVFVGEKRSARAVRLGVRWQDGRLSGKTLHDALRAANIDPAAEVYVNVFREGAGLRVDRAVLHRLRCLAAGGLVVVGMGCKVQRVLAQSGLDHLPLVHPAARGVIRTRALYQAHVAAVLGPHLGDTTPAGHGAQQRDPDRVRREQDAL